MTDTHELISLTADIVSAMVSNNKVSTSEIPALIQATFTALEGAGAPAPAPEAKQEPAVSIRQSVKHDYIVCLEDGKKVQMLKRYLRTNFDMSPEEYRAKWNLPRDYPMVCPAYSDRRRDLAHKLGLGKQRRNAAAQAVKAAPAKVAKAAKGVVAGLEAARQHLGGDAPAKASAPARKAPAKRATKSKEAAAEA